MLGCGMSPEDHDRRLSASGFLPATQVHKAHQLSRRRADGSHVICSPNAILTMADTKQSNTDKASGKNWSRVANAYSAIIDETDATNPVGAACNQILDVVDATFPLTKPATSSIWAAARVQQ